MQEIAAAQTTLNDIAVASATNAQANSKLYTDQQIQALKAILTSTYATLVYVDNHKWLSADITDLPTTLNTFGNSITVTGAITGTTSNGVITTKFAPIADPINPTDPANMRWVSDQFEEVNKSIQDLDVVGCTFETWLNYWARADAYLDELYDTVDEEYYRQMGWIT